MNARRIMPVGVLLAAVAALGVSAAFAASHGHSGMGSGGRSAMMGPGGAGVSVGDGPVTSVDAARRRANAIGAPLGLHAAEVMRFEDNWYVVMDDGNGTSATEVLVDASTGTASLEPGPAMMWNTRYGMMGRVSGDMASMMGSVPGTGGMMGAAGSARGTGGMMGTGRMTGAATAAPGGPRLGMAKARTVAQGWLDVTSPGITIGDAEAFPGYFTFDAARDGATVGMLSVNAATGAVWPHTWHGRFIGSDG